MNWFKKLMLKYAIDYIERSKGGKTMFGKINDFLDGKKQYLSALALVIEGVLAYVGNHDLNALVLKLIAAWAVAANRASTAKLEAAQKQVVQVVAQKME